MSLVNPEDKLLKTITEVARELGIKEYVLRYWETQFPQINPSRQKGKRLYDINDVKTIKTIQDLLHNQKYTIQGAKNFLYFENEQDNDKNMLDVLAELKKLYSFLREAMSDE
ncbi:MAG: transcriptional regulator [Candidatus Xenolissoclinum pacificiensis L6]|uniref:Transcriptional regulator n=1 Tax=Candidatus Xenolissoclinum pacificiensis L6 TaxID=1401685 RepID=W2V1Y8_9RICK|nr:MAG: transcriptional regulator [Candidatus Xenolissoclinum pacificiensis L6]